MEPQKIAIFLSGAGSNAEAIMQHFHGRDDIKVTLVVSSNPLAGGLKKAEHFDVPTLILEKAAFYGNELLLSQLRERGIDWIVLAGFLWLVPPYLIRAFPARIINIHPALLPKYGGKGMYGAKVHEAVIAAGEQESGITIHYIDEHYDEGVIISQEKCKISFGETPETLAAKIHQLEHRVYPQVIDKTISAFALK
ncbi:MAG: phosphoribosylglycinamide formyltransferase [Chitinophagales bacterium]|nr:phosphoribosylglycinamide formyltransferase [Chitinophagales bacterium]